MLGNLCYETLGNLDGGAARKAINKAIRAVVADFEDRSADGKPREIIINVLIEPRDNESEAEITVKVRAKLPDYRTDSTVAKMAFASGEPQLAFNDLATDDPNQRTIDEALHSGKQRRKTAAESEGE